MPKLKINDKGQVLLADGTVLKVDDEDVEIIDVVTKDKTNEIVEKRLKESVEKIKALQEIADKTPAIQKMLDDEIASKTKIEEDLSTAESRIKTELNTKINQSNTERDEAVSALGAERKAHITTSVSHAILAACGSDFISPNDDIVPRLLRVHKRDAVLDEMEKPTGAFTDNFEVDVFKKEENGEETVTKKVLNLDLAVQAIKTNPVNSHYLIGDTKGGQPARKRSPVSLRNKGETDDRSSAQLIKDGIEQNQATGT